jgi:hypothetical protein
LHKIRRYGKPYIAEVLLMLTIIGYTPPPAVSASTPPRPGLTADFDPDKNPDDSQNQGYERKKKPTQTDKNEMPANEKNRLYEPITPGVKTAGSATGGAIMRKPVSMQEADAVDLINPQPMLRRRAEAYERLMPIF